MIVSLLVRVFYVGDYTLWTMKLMSKMEEKTLKNDGTSWIMTNAWPSLTIMLNQMLVAWTTLLTIK
jgi:hypothetical protein